MQYKNQYGSALLVPVTDPMHVSAISYATMSAQIEPVKLTMVQAEQLALITENQRVQLCFCMDSKVNYVVYHLTPDTIQLCRAEINYIEDQHATPAEIIAQHHRSMSYSVGMNAVCSV